MRYPSPSTNTSGPTVDVEIVHINGKRRTLREVEELANPMSFVFKDKRGKCYAFPVVNIQEITEVPSRRGVV